MDLPFAVGSLLVLPFWLLMIGLPGWSGTRRLMRSTLPLVPLPVLYALLLALHIPELFGLLEAVAANPSKSPLSVLAELLGTPEGATVAWLHMLALDLFVGRWAYLDSQERGLHALAMAPVLWATFLFGPIGLMLYLLLRASIPSPPAKSAEAVKPFPASPLHPRRN
ncbi:MAG: DUF4281 domain-containing protein [Gemmataceae bacterium]|nr:DUF4281 domain-containing protein [Gemmataceae bacterium]